MRYPFAVCALAAIGVAQADSAVATKFRSQRNWTIALPGDAFVKVGSAIRLGEHEFAAHRDGTGIAIDTDGDGESDVTVQGKEGFVKLSNGDFRYAIRLANRGGGWYFASSCVRQTKIGGQRVRLIDNDANGRFDDYGRDAMIVGRGKTATFLSRAVSVGEQVLSIDVAADGSSVDVSPFEGETGTLDLTSSLDTKGKLLSAIVRSTDGEYSFDLARGKLSVPAGTYRIESGAIGLGETTVTVERGRAEDLTVTGREVATLDWGGPATAEFAYARQGDKIEFSPDRVWYYGASGEQYVSWNPVGKSPTFEVKKVEDGEVLATAIFPGSC